MNVLKKTSVGTLGAYPYEQDGCPGLNEEHASDFENENPQLHCERGATGLSGKKVRELYIEAVTKNI